MAKVKSCTSIVSDKNMIRSLSDANIELQQQLLRSETDLVDAKRRIAELEAGGAVSTIIRDAQSDKLKEVVNGLRVELASARFNVSLERQKPALEAIDRAVTIIEGIG